jgi:hypothetical protein
VILFRLEWESQYIDLNRRQFFWFVLPAYLGVLLYLLYHVRDLTQGDTGGKLRYSGFLLLFVALSISIPISYGKNIFDFPVYQVLKIDSTSLAEKRYDLESKPRTPGAETGPLTLRDSPLLTFLSALGDSADGVPRDAEDDTQT